MAEPLANGTANGQPERFIGSINPDDPERERELMKSVEVREDMRAMEARKRVSEILNSQAFREELEEIIEAQLQSGPHPASLVALQQISQLILGNSSSATRSLAGALGGPIIPIADIRGINASVYSKGERVLRCKLAAVYRLMDLHGWTKGIYNHISVRLSQDKEHFLVNPFGLMYSEITAGSLVKVDMQGNLVDRGNTSLGVNKAGFTLHSAIHAARPDVKCIIHTHVFSTVAVSVMKQGLLPLTQEALVVQGFGISYHDYHGILVDEAERNVIARNLGPNSKVLFLRNHGVVTCGSSVEEAWYLMAETVEACEAQVRFAPLGLDNLVMPSEAAKEQVKSALTSASVNMGPVDGGKKWKVGELEFEAWMRLLDNAGYRTGHFYKQPILKLERSDRQTSDVEYPPATSVLTFYDEAGNLRPEIKEAQERNKRQQKTEWLNTPNVYKKEELDEIGTDNPKKITKWVPETDSPRRQATPIKVSNPNQFAPQGANPKEFTLKQQEIKDGYYYDKISAGPQSKVLEGGMTDGQILEVTQSSTGDHIMIVGAASKGIIKREHQHNAVVYKSHYTTNPFDKMTDEELKAYEEAVKRGEKPPKEEVLQAVRQQEVESTLEISEAPKQESAIDYEAVRRAQSKETNVDSALNDSKPESKAEPKSSAQPAVQPAPVARQESPVSVIRRGDAQYSSMREPPPSVPLSAEVTGDGKAKNFFQRSKSERKPKKGDKEAPPSPEATAQNGDHDEEVVEENGQDSPSKSDKDKKKKDKKSRMPSFSFGKKKEKDTTKKTKSSSAL